MITLVVLLIATLFLSYSNGANDNFKGVATLYAGNSTRESFWVETCNADSISFIF